MTVLQILEEIGADSKRSHKLTVIRKYQDNELFKRVLTLALDPYINFYIRQIPDYDPKGGKTLDWALAELEKLSNRQLTGHAGIEHLRSILSGVSLDDAIVVGRIIGKDLRCGAADGTVNSVIDGFIPTYPCLLARPYDAKNINNITYPALSQLKADGIRVNFHVSGTTVSICGRSGRSVYLLGEMDTDIRDLGAQFAVPVVFDGELVVVDKDGKLLSRKVGNGIINKAIKGTISPAEAKMVRAQLWDVIPLSEFIIGKSSEKYKERFKKVSNAIAATAQIEKPAKYWIIPSKEVASLPEAVTHFQEMLEAGEEGTILKNYIGLWEDTRSKHLVKFKAEKDADLEIIGWNPGTGKFTNMVGSLITASSDRKVVTSISGFSDDLRAEITRDIDSWMGSIVAVLYNERITSQGKDREDVDSLFLPRFAERRYDKLVANSSGEIK
jgi:hypothetical protein